MATGPLLPVLLLLTSPQLSSRAMKLSVSLSLLTVAVAPMGVWLLSMLTGMVVVAPLASVVGVVSTSVPPVRTSMGWVSLFAPAFSTVTSKASVPPGSMGALLLVMSTRKFGMFSSTVTCALSLSSSLLTVAVTRGPDSDCRWCR